MSNVIQDISPEAQAVIVRERPYKDHRDRDVHEVNFHVARTDFTLHMKSQGDKLILLGIGSASKEHAKKGHGFATMQRAIKYAADNELRFFVNEFVPPNAAPLIHKLVRHGYDVRQPVQMRSSPSLEIGTTAHSFEPFKIDWH